MSITPIFPSPSRPLLPKPKRTQTPSVQHPLTFGDATARNYGSRDRIPDDVYRLLSNAPKNELHIHQGGSSSVDFLNYRLRMGIEKNKLAYEAQSKSSLNPAVNGASTPGNGFNAGIIDELPVFQTGKPPRMVRFTEPDGKPLSAETVRESMEQALTRENLRNYYRFSMASENQKPYMDSEDLAETTATHQPGNEIVSATQSAELQKQTAESLKAYLHTSAKFNMYVKNPPAFYLLAKEYAKGLALENVRYTEYRVSPTGSGIGGANGNNIEDVLSAVNAGFSDAKAELDQRLRNLDYGLIVLFERQNRSGQNDAPDAKIQRATQLARDVVRLKEAGKYNICGVDLAGDEARNPVTEFKPAFDIINEYNSRVAPEKRLGITIHAGETPKSGPFEGYQSIENAIKIAENKDKDQKPLTQVRIGHGLQIINSSPLLKQAFEIYCKYPNDWEKQLKRAGIGIDTLRKNSPLLDKVITDQIVLEMCPKSNLQTYGIHPGFPNQQFSVRRDDYSAEAYKRHPAVFLSRLGVKVAISSDNRTISNTDVTNEYVKLFKYAGLTYDDFKKMVMNGFEGAFVADPVKKTAIITDVKQQFERLEHDPDARHAIELMGGQSKVNDAARTTTPTLAPAKLWAKFETGFTQQMQAMRASFNQRWQRIKN